MMRLHLLLTLIALLLFSGCGGGAFYESRTATAPPAEYGGSYQPPASATAGKSSADYAPPSPLPRGGGSTVMTEPVRPEPPRQESRPGLGTEFGETRTSRVRDVTFVRADPDRPFALATMHYNDRQGIQALANFHQDQDSAFREVASGGGALTVSIHDEYGSPLEGFHVGDRHYVVGNQGQRYTINITNHTGHRFEVIATVDGLDVVNGRDGSLQNRGYVLMPYATLDIDGFRQSQDAVAAFRFASVRDSYAAQTGSARNVGVIGIAFFAERGDSFAPISTNELQLRDTAIPFPGTDTRFAQPPRR